MNVARFFRSLATYEALTGSNSYTGDTFSPAASIRVRWDFQNRLVRNGEGQEVTVSAHVSTLTALAVGDRITDPAGVARRVIAVRTNRDTRGRLSHYVASLA